MSLRSDGSVYNCRGNQVFARDVLISRIVYQCPKCNHLSKTIADSDHHFITRHQSVRQSAPTVAHKKTRPAKARQDAIIQKIESAIKLTTKVETNKTIVVRKVRTKRSQEIVPPLKRVEPVVDVTAIYGNDFKDFEETQPLQSIKTYSKRKPIGVDLQTTATEEVMDQKSGIIVSNLKKCELCDMQFNSIGLALHQHIHTNPHVCSAPFCEHKFPTESQLKAHIFEAHEKEGLRPPDGYQCSVCDRKYVNERDLKYHMEIHTNPKTCDICGKRDFSSKGLIKHMKTHNKDYKYRCIPCNKTFPYYSNLMSHKLLHTNPYVCDREGCGKKFASKHTLKVHLIKHSDDKPYECDFAGCGKRFKHKSFIQTHKNIAHLNIRPYECGDCGQTFGTKINVERHIKSRHIAKDNKFACDWPECAKSFPFQHLLTRHTELHTGAKPYVCDIVGCDKNFATIHLMQIHKKTHSARKMRCDLCPTLLASKQSWAQHMKAVHNATHTHLSKRKGKASKTKVETVVDG